MKLTHEQDCHPAIDGVYPDAEEKAYVGRFCLNDFGVELGVCASVDAADIRIDAFSFKALDYNEYFFGSLRDLLQETIDDGAASLEATRSALEAIAASLNP